jgi:hypothetical protein
MRLTEMIVAALAAWIVPMAAWGQIAIQPGNAAVGGVGISTDGVLSYRQTAPVTPPPGGRKADLAYVSLPGALAQWRTARDAGQEVPPDVRYLKGLTRLECVFVFPAEHDIVLAGPAEPFKADNPLEPLGTITGRPVVQLEDLVVALRAVQNPRSSGAPDGTGGGGFYGCSLENPANFQEIWNPTLAKFGAGPRDKLLAEMKKALGPQVVKIFGVPEDSRTALTMLAADYRLKRLSMGLETVTGLGNALGTEVAAPRIWFEPAYEPLLVAPDGNAYELRGPRLKVLAAPQQFNPQGANDAQKRFGENFSKKMNDVAAKVEALADLQNVTDCFMVAALLRQDRLAEKSGVDFTWLLSAQGAVRYKTATLPVPKTAETVVRVSGNVIAQGGVALPLADLTGVPRENDGKTPFSAATARPTEGWFLVKPK